MSRAAALLLLVTACGGATTTTPLSSGATATRTPLGDELARVVEGALRDKPPTSVSVAVLQHGKPLLVQGFGLADVERQVAARPDTIYRLASLTKSFTAAIVLGLADEGKLSLDDAVTKFLPELTSFGGITLRHLLNHTSGIADYTGLPGFRERIHRAAPRRELVAMFSAAPLQFAPGARFAYSNSNYYLLGLVIEKLTGKPYGEVVRARIAEPLGLRDLHECADAMTAPREARPYTVKDGAAAPAEPLVMAHPFAAGALCATAGEVAAWIGALGGQRAVSAKRWTDMKTPVTLNDGSVMPYGLGLSIRPFDGHTRIGHTGAINGFTTAMDLYPDDELVVVVLQNSEADLVDELSDKLARTVLGTSAAPADADRPITAAEAAPFEGRYAIAALGVSLHVLFADGQLKLHAGSPSAPSRALHWQGGDAFVAGEIGLRLAFTRDGGRVTGLVFEQNGARLLGVRDGKEPRDTKDSK
ncbi:MAG: serine hydrolase domain-containing protein [Kofleriaceae bacterium]